MRKLLIGMMMLGSQVAFSAEPTDDAIREAIISKSISSYRGSCPCPYNITRGGSRCGGRSAYSKPGGYSPTCYKSDISGEDVARYRKR